MKTLVLSLIVLLCGIDLAYADGGYYFYQATPFPVVYNVVPPPPPLVVFQPVPVLVQPQPVIIYQPVVVPPPQVILIDNRWVQRPCFPLFINKY